VEDAYFVLEGCITVGRDLHLRFETRANKPPRVSLHGTANNSGASRPPASTAGSIGTPIFAANRFPRRSRTHQYGLVGIPAPPCAAPPGMAMAGIRSARSLPRRYRLKSRHGFPLISIEQNNLSRAPGYRVWLQLVDICRTVDFEDALRREASKGEKPQSRCDGSRRFAGNSARESALGGMRRSLPRDTTDDERSSMGF